MSEIVTLHKNNNNNRLPSKLPAKELRRDVALPGPEANELTERDARQLAEVMEALDSAARCYSKRELPDAIDRAERFLGNGFGNRLAFAMSRANRDDLIVHLCSLVKSFPNPDADEVFGRLLYKDVAALEPTRGALEAGCRRLRRTHKFPRLPIADVCDAVGLAEWTFKLAARHFQELPARIAAARNELARQSEIEERQARLLNPPTEKKI